jgi:hypothetical protein
MSNDPDDAGPAGRAPLIAPQGTLPLDDGLALAARWLRQVSAMGSIDPKKATDLATLRDLSFVVTEDANEGAQEADRLDEEARVAKQTYLGLLADVRGRILFVGTPVVPQTYSILGWDEKGRPIALSHDGGQIIMAMGALGAGKSHLPHRIAQQTPHGSLPSLTLSDCSAYLSAAPR